MKIRPIYFVAVLGALLFGCDGDVADTSPAPPEFSGVLFGPIENIRESHADWIWGDSINWLCQQWSIRGFGQSGWFYGTRSAPWSTTDVFVLDSSIDPLSIVAAENLAYTTGTVAGSIGDTVFFRGTNGFFGAWTIDKIEGEIGTDSMLSGTWYFKAGGGGDFTRELRPGEAPMQQGSCTSF